MQAVADRLNEGGHVTRTGSPWSAVQVKRQSSTAAPTRPSNRPEGIGA